MAPTVPAKVNGAVIIDASVAIAIASREAGREPKATAEIHRYDSAGYSFYAPGVLIAETLYVLCRKRASGLLTAADHAEAIIDFEILMGQALPPPMGDASLIQRADAIATGYGCSRSADGLYIALAEQIGATVPTVLLTFDSDMPNQATRNAPSVSIQVLTT